MKTRCASTSICHVNKAEAAHPNLNSLPHQVSDCSLCCTRSTMLRISLLQVSPLLETSTLDASEQVGLYSENPGIRNPLPCDLNLYNHHLFIPKPLFSDDCQVTRMIFQPGLVFNLCCKMSIAQVHLALRVGLGLYIYQARLLMQTQFLIFSHTTTKNALQRNLIPDLDLYIKGFNLVLILLFSINI